MKGKFLFLSFVLFFLFFLFAFHGVEITALSSPTIALTNGTLIDGTGGPLLFQAVVIIEKGLIADIGEQNKIRIPADATIIDLKGSTVLPGFINTHVHHGYSNFNLTAWAKSGVTTVRDLGGNPRNDLFAFRDAAIRNPQNARLVAAGPIVTVPKGYPMVPWGAPIGLPVRSPDDARNKVSQLLDEGVAVIKITLEGGKTFNRKIPRLSIEEAAAIVAVAHQRETIVSAASVSQKIRLRFKPEVGKTYAYSYTTDLDKTTFGKTAHGNLKGTISMEILERLENKYRVKIQINLESSNMSPMVFNRMKQQNAEPRFITISDGYVWETQGAYNLCFPDRQVLVGDEWTGSASFHIGDLSTLEQPDVKVQYEIVKEEKIEDDTCFTLICKPVENEIEVPFQLGSLGIKCDEGGRITAVDEKAEIGDEMRIGDLIVAINGHKAINARARSALFERYIETLDDMEKPVQITVLRDEKEITVDLKKHPVTIGTMKVEVQDFLRTVSFSLNKGIILSDVSKALYSVTYDFVEELPFVDDYTGKEPLKRLSKMEIPPRIYDYEWNLILNPLDL